MRINLIPMAGRGQRFAQSGFALPKPLIPVSGRPMLERAIADMPEADEWIFIIREEHKTHHHIDELLKKIVPRARILIDPHPTGQLISCLIARDCVDPADSLFIASCDNGYLYDANAYERLIADSAVDSVIWTFTRREMLRIHPQSWGWCAMREDGIGTVSVKVPVSDRPYEDHAVVSSFFFRRAADFFAAADRMCATGKPVNNEFYVDAIVNYMPDDRRAVIFDVDLYVGWGRPRDLAEYVELEKVFLRGDSPIGGEHLNLWPLWKKYFSRISRS